MLSRRLLVGGEEVDLVGDVMGRVIRRLSATDGVAPPLCDGMRARVARWRTGWLSATGLGEMGRLGAGRDRLFSRGTSRED